MRTHTDTARVSRFRVPRSRGALTGLLLMVFGAWAGIVAFIGPYLDFGFTPAPNTSWNWTAARGYLEVAPGAAAFLAGLVLLMAAHRITASMAAWLGAAAGAWLIVGVPLATGVLDIGIGSPDPAATQEVQALEVLFYFTAIGAAILAVSCVAIGRLAVRSEREVRLVERAAEREAARRTQTEHVEPAAGPTEPEERWGAPSEQQPVAQQPTTQQPVVPQQPTAQQPVEHGPGPAQAGPRVR